MDIDQDNLRIETAISFRAPHKH